MKRIVSVNMIRLEKQHHPGIITVTEFLDAKEQRIKRSNLEIGPDGISVRKKERYKSPN